MKILDIHTHHAAPQPLGIIGIRLTPGEQPSLETNQYYSIGIHPWDSMQEPTPQMWEMLTDIAQNPQIAAIGETGLDLTPRGGLLFRQMQIFKRHIEISEQVGKPLIIHGVKADEVLLGMRKNLQPKQPWVLHGFRRKPTVAAQLLRAGFYLSIGAEFNSEAARMIPAERLFAETDDSPLTIDRVIEKIAIARDETVDSLSLQLARNFDAITNS